MRGNSKGRILLVSQFWVAGSKSVDRGREAGHGRAHHAGANLAAVFTSDANVHSRRYTSFGHAENIDSSGTV